MFNEKIICYEFLWIKLRGLGILHHKLQYLKKKETITPLITLELGLQDAICLTETVVSMLGHCMNFIVIRYELGKECIF